MRAKSGVRNVLPSLGPTWVRFMACWALGTGTLPGLAARMSRQPSLCGRESCLCHSGFSLAPTCLPKQRTEPLPAEVGRRARRYPVLISIFRPKLVGAQLLLRERHEDAQALFLQVQLWTDFGQVATK